MSLLCQRAEPAAALRRAAAANNEQLWKPELMLTPAVLSAQLAGTGYLSIGVGSSNHNPFFSYKQKPGVHPNSTTSPARTEM